MEPNRIQTLLIEDNPADARLIREMLREVSDQPFELVEVSCLADGLEKLAGRRFDSVLLDLSLPDSTGLETFCAVNKRAPHLPVVVLSGLDDESVAVRAVKEGAQDYLAKGDAEGNLIGRALRYAIERKRAEELVVERKALERSNEELEAFASIAAHDLQEPLRKIQAFGDRLRIRTGESLGEQACDDLERMIGSADRMRKLIKSLLDYSRVAITQRPLDAVDLGRSVRRSAPTCRWRPRGLLSGHGAVLTV